MVVVKTNFNKQKCTGPDLDMMSGFRRSISLEDSSPSASPARCRSREDPQHLRSTSLPCRSHPALSHLLDQIRSSPDRVPRASSSGLDRIDRLLAALDDVLRLPQSHDALRRHPAWAEHLLDGFLRLADAHGSFRSASVALGQHYAEARAAIRRGDPVRLASAARSYRRTEKELTRIATAIKNLSRLTPFGSGICANIEEAEVVTIVTEAVAATAATSIAVFLGISALSSAAVASMSKSSWKIWAKRDPSYRGRGEAALEELESVEGLEEGSGRVFRTLVNIRVSLLNALTPSL